MAAPSIAGAVRAFAAFGGVKLRTESAGESAPPASGMPEVLPSAKHAKQQAVLTDVAAASPKTVNGASDGG